MTELTVVIVNYNTAQLLINCLTSLKHSLNFAKLTNLTEIIVVDNGSSDDSLKKVKAYFPVVKLIQNRQNLGFSKANNQAIKKACGRYILLLNSDTEIDRPAIKQLLKIGQSSQKIAAVGGKLVNYDGTIQQSVGFYPNLCRVFFWMFFIDDLPFFASFIKSYHQNVSKFYKVEHEVDWVSGACLLLNREILMEAGLFDENIFMYGEEVELCFRLKQLGYKIIYTPEAVIMHLKGASQEGPKSGIIDEFKSLIYIYQKHHSLRQKTLLRYLLKFGALMRLFLFGIIARRKSFRSFYAKAFKVV